VIPHPVVFITTVAVKVVFRVNNLGFVLNERLTTADHFRKVCPKVYWILRSLRPHASHTSFEVKRKLVLILLVLMLHHGVELGWHLGLLCAKYI
jgi:hypothetical protein